MRRESILFKLNILFVLALIATLIAGFSMALHIVKKENVDTLFKARLVANEMRMRGSISPELLHEFNFKLLNSAQKQKILSQMRIGKMHRRMAPKDPFASFGKHIRVMHYKSHSYIHIMSKRGDMLLQDNKTLWSCCITQMLIFAGMLALLIVMYILLRKSLLPLKDLQKNITNYGEGEAITPTYTDKQDEVSMVSNAFYGSISKLEKLRSSRQLFIRNIFH